MSVLRNNGPMILQTRMRLRAKAMRPWLKVAAFVFLAVHGLAMCGRVSGYEESFDRAVLAAITTFELADTSRADSIHVHLAGIIGPTTAYGFDRINAPRTDSLFQIGVWGRWRESSGEVYEPLTVVFDTNLVLQSQRFGMHFVRVFSPDSTYIDSTYVQ